MDKEQSVMIRAICCIIVILVHIPQQHSNFIQDAIGSFGYIAVTIFFMLSAYGLKYSINHKKDYLKHFWKNRILVLLIPFWIANTLATLIAPQETIIANVFKIIGIKGISFVTILLGYYILFWIVCKLVKEEKKRDSILCTIVFLYSILGKIFNLSVGWQVEAMGLIYGILFYYFAQELKRINQLKEIILFGILSTILGVFYVKYKEIYMIGTYLLRTILGINIILFLTGILNRISIDSVILKGIGNISYEIFLMHEIVIKLLFNINIPSVLWILLVILLTIVSAFIINYIDKKLIKMIKTVNIQPDKNELTN